MRAPSDVPEREHHTETLGEGKKRVAFEQKVVFYWAEQEAADPAHEQRERDVPAALVPTGRPLTMPKTE